MWGSEGSKEEDGSSDVHLADNKVDGAGGKLEGGGKGDGTEGTVRGEADVVGFGH